MFASSILVKGFTSIQPLDHENDYAVVRSSAKLSPKGISKLQDLASTNLRPRTVIELPSGHIVIRWNAKAVLIIASDSTLLAPLKLKREIFALAKKYPSNSLVSFQELSELAREQFRSSLIFQHPTYDLSSNSKFSLSFGLQTEISAGGHQVVESRRPTQSTKEERDRIDELLRAAPIVVARSEQDSKDIWENLSHPHDSIYGDDWADRRQSIEAERYGLELFQGWYQGEMQKLDDQIQQTLAAGTQWQRFLRSRGAKSASELQSVDPDEYKRLVGMLEHEYDVFGFPTAESARVAFQSASISTRFIFHLTSALDGHKDLFSMSLTE